MELGHVGHQRFEIARFDAEHPAAREVRGLAVATGLVSRDGDEHHLLQRARQDAADEDAPWVVMKFSTVGKPIRVWKSW